MSSTRNLDYQVLIQSNNPAEGQQSIVVRAPMPESFVFDTSSNYEAPFAQGLFSNNMLRLATAAIGLRTAVQAMTAQLWQGTNDTELGLELEFQTETDPLMDIRKPILDLNKLIVPLTDSATGLLKSPGPQLDSSFANAASILTDASTQIASEATQVKDQLEKAGEKVKGASLNDSSRSTADGKGQSNALKNGLGTAAYWKSKVKNQVSIQIGNYMFFDSVVITNVQQTYVSNLDPITKYPHHVKVSVRFKPLFMITQADLDTIFMSGGGVTGNALGAKLGSALVSGALGLFQ
ncbi:hypothetical protein [Burkholderia phage BCSR5]|nr:hypothetical protein [Burkholderia phage BCSR5]